MRDIKREKTLLIANYRHIKNRRVDLKRLIKKEDALLKTHIPFINQLEKAKETLQKIGLVA